VSLRLSLTTAALLCALPAHAQRAATTHPDLQGVWTNGTATPLQRPPEFADRPFFSAPEAAEFERTTFDRLLLAFPEADRALQLTDLNDTYFEPSEMKVLADLRTSQIVDPPNGLLPPLLPEAIKRARPVRSYDDPEGLPLGERCLVHSQLGTSVASPPQIPIPLGGLNTHQIVQTPDTVLIFAELIHDVRIIRLNGTHAPEAIRKWMGDSIGRWEGDTLVVDTTNFRSDTRFQGSGERLHVVERFRRVNATTLEYRVTVDDPETWARSWTADIPFLASSSPIFEYACHEHNVSMENVLRGARADEQRAGQRQPR
jgi:hypothetical protein